MAALQIQASYSEFHETMRYKTANQHQPKHSDRRAMQKQVHLGRRRAEMPIPSHLFQL